MRFDDVRNQLIMSLLNDIKTNEKEPFVKGSFLDVHL